MDEIVGVVAPFPTQRFLSFVNQLRIQTKEHGAQILGRRMIGTQRYVLSEIIKGRAAGQSSFVILKARQIGMSTLFLALDLFWAFEYAGMTGAFATHEDKTIDNFRATIEMFLVHLPPSHRIPILKHNRNILILKNGSQFSYLSAGTSPGKSAGLGRSGAYVYIHGTEVAFWGNEDDISELKATSAQHNPNRMQIWETTANGFNHFEKQYESAKHSKTVRAIFCGWWRNELYRLEKTHPFYKAFMPSTSLHHLERQRIRAVREAHGVELAPEQIAWYRWALEEEQKGDQSLMDSKYPWTEEDSFQTTGSKFFMNASLTAAIRRAKRAPVSGMRYELGQQWVDTALIQTTPQKGELHVFEDRDPAGHYAIGCDPAYGSSDDNDSTAIQVLRCFSDKCTQVAEYISPRVTTYECAWVLAHIAGYYGNSMLNLEIYGPGNAVNLELENLRKLVAREGRGDGQLQKIGNVLGNMRYFLYRRQDTMSGGVLLHTKTTQEIKQNYANGFRDSFQLGRCEVRSERLLDQMKSIVFESGWVGGEGKKHDDMFMAMILAHATWQHWIRPKLENRGLTYAKAMQVSQQGPGAVIQTQLMNYLKANRIVLKEPQRQRT